VYDDTLLRKHWNEWAKDATSWGKTDFALWRFVRRCGLSRAVERAEQEVAGSNPAVPIERAVVSSRLHLYRKGGLAHAVKRRL